MSLSNRHGTLLLYLWPAALAALSALAQLILVEFRISWLPQMRGHKVLKAKPMNGSA
jgi:hypothetical protein